MKISNSFVIKYEYPHLNTLNKHAVYILLAKLRITFFKMLGVLYGYY